MPVTMTRSVIPRNLQIFEEAFSHSLNKDKTSGMQISLSSALHPASDICPIKTNSGVSFEKKLNTPKKQDQNGKVHYKVQSSSRLKSSNTITMIALHFAD